MKTFIHALIGGVAVIGVAGILGVAQNAVRSNPVKLVQNVAPPKAASTATTGEAEEGDAHALEDGEIALEEMQARFDSGMSILLDARSAAEYAEGHIPGAVNIPYDRLAEYLETLQYEATPDQPVVCYCKGPSCDLSHRLATELRLMGYEDVVVFKAGWEGWTEADLETVTGMEP